ncbi:NUT family member 2F [Sciurus carolinensis]|uniref:NUT family member 2F n=1 Tax=Sciurus carolinensis TaxID=30640 RepID=UPI001FB1E13C|nr:NUT family member 2F [Sciurus carolinensis]
MAAMPAVGEPPPTLAHRISQWQPQPALDCWTAAASATAPLAKRVSMREVCGWKCGVPAVPDHLNKRPGKNFNPGAFMNPFRGLPFLPAAPVPAHQPFWEPPVAQRVTTPISQGNPLVLSACPEQPYVAGLFGFGQQGPERRPIEPSPIQNIAHTQGPLNWGSPGSFVRVRRILLHSSRHCLPQPVGASGTTGAPVTWDRQPSAPRPVALVAPFMFPMNAQQRPGRVYGEGALPTLQPAVPPDDSNEPQSNYENFRRWQRFKTLVRRHLPQTPDVEALSCFLVPVLWSLCQREPTITMEEGLRKGLQEWQRTSNFDRMIFYETAEKFMEFEAAEELEDPRMQLAGVFQSQPPPVPQRLDYPRPPVNAVQQSAAKLKVPHTKVSETKVSETKARETKARVIKVPETTVPEEIPPEAVQECEDIMDHVVGPPNFAMCEPSSSFIGEPAANLGQEELEQQPLDNDLDPDPSLLSYVDEDFDEKVETMIQPSFLEELLPSKPDINILALMKELEQEEELTSGQDSRASEAVASLNAEKRDHHADGGDSVENGNPEKASQDSKKCRTTHPELLGPKDNAILPGGHGSSSLRAVWSNLPPQNLRSSSANRGNKGGVGPRRAATSGGPHGTPNGCSVDDDLQSLDFLLFSQHHLLPWGLSQSQGPHVETLCSGEQAVQAPLPQRGGLSHHPPPAAMAKKRALAGCSYTVEKRSCLEPTLQETGGQYLDPEVVEASQPHKRKWKATGNQEKKRRT